MKRNKILSICFALSLLGVLVISNAGDGLAARLTIKFAQCCPPDQAYGRYAHGFTDHIQKYSNGEIKVENLDGGVLGSEQDMAHAVQIGTIQMAGITSNNVGQLAPSLNVVVLPYINETMEDVVGEYGLFHQGPYLKELNKRVLKESGSLRILGGFTNGFRTFFTKNRPVKNLNDLKGLKIRVPKNPVMEAYWKAWGVSPYPVAWSEVFTAIQQGVIDAFDSPIDVILRMGFYQYIKYITLTHYTPQAAACIVNNKWLKGLSKADQDLILKAARDNDKWHYNWIKEDQKTIIKTLTEKHGTTFLNLEDEDVWKKKAMAVWPKLYKYVGGGKAWVDLTLQYKKTHKIN